MSHFTVIHYDPKSETRAVVTINIQKKHKKLKLPFIKIIRKLKFYSHQKKNKVLNPKGILPKVQLERKSLIHELHNWINKNQKNKHQN